MCVFRNLKRPYLFARKFMLPPPVATGEVGRRFFFPFGNCKDPPWRHISFPPPPPFFLPFLFRGPSPFQRCFRSGGEVVKLAQPTSPPFPPCYFFRWKKFLFHLPGFFFGGGGGESDEVFQIGNWVKI